MDFSTMSKPEIQAWLRENRPEVLAEAAAPSPGPDVVTRTDLEEAIVSASQETARVIMGQVREALDERATDTQVLAESLLEEREMARDLRVTAHELIENAEGLTDGWKRELKERYAVTADGPTPALLIEAEDDQSPEEILRERVEADVDRALGLIRESGGAPVVTGQGPEGDGSKKSVKDNAFVDFMMESGGFEKPEDVAPALNEAARI